MSSGFQSRFLVWPFLKTLPKELAMVDDLSPILL